MKEAIRVVTPQITAEVEVYPVACRAIKYHGKLYPVCVFKQAHDDRFLLLRKNGEEWVWIMSAKNINKFRNLVDDNGNGREVSFWRDVTKLINEAVSLVKTILPPEALDVEARTRAA